MWYIVIVVVSRPFHVVFSWHISKRKTIIIPLTTDGTIFGSKLWQSKLSTNFVRAHIDGWRLSNISRYFYFECFCLYWNLGVIFVVVRNWFYIWWYNFVWWLLKICQKKRNLLIFFECIVESIVWPFIYNKRWLTWDVPPTSWEAGR